MFQTMRVVLDRTKGSKQENCNPQQCKDTLCRGCLRYCQSQSQAGCQGLTLVLTQRRLYLLQKKIFQSLILEILNMATNLVELRSTGRRELGPWAHRGTRWPGDSMRHRGRLSGTTARRAPSRCWSGCCTGTPPCRWGMGWSQYLKKFTTMQYNLQCLVTTAGVQLVFCSDLCFLLPVIGWACSHLIPLHWPITD